MNKHFKRITAFLLALVMVLGFSTVSSAEGLQSKDNAGSVHVYTDEEYKALDDDVFALIGSVKEDALQAKTYTEGPSAYLTEEDYISLVPDVIKAIEASDTYVEGTLQQNGSFLVWQTKAGIPCCYSPRMEAKLSKPSSLSSEEIQAIEEDALNWAKEIGSSVSEINVAGHFPTSKNIGLIQPYWESNSSYEDSTFCSYSPYYKSMWQSLYEATGGSGLRYSMSNATVNNIAKTMEQCGLVIFDSHGTTDYEGYDYTNGNYDYTSKANSSYLCLITNSGVTSADTQPQTGTYGTYYNCLSGSGYAYVNGACIANHMSSNAPGSLLYMGICLGMATDKMFTGLRNKGVEVVYGYSQSVSFAGELKYMKSILGYVKSGDNFSTALSKSKAALGNWDPAYSNMSIAQAIREKAAFPIVVSTEDIYPGHGNVDAVQNVYSTWTLFQQYTVTAVSNNTNYGTVSVNGYTITASPKSGYYASGYAVTKGTATVQQDGNTFNVTPSSDCTVRIDFSPRAAIKVNCYADGSLYQTLNGYAGEALVLPSSSPAIDGWEFIGWTTYEIEEDLNKPSYFAPGSAVTLSGGTSLYALYRGYSEDVSAELVFDLVTEAPADWSGDYVITNGFSAEYIMKGLSGSSSYESSSSGGAVKFASSGITLSENALSNVDDAYVFTAAPSGSYYTFKNKSTGTYLASVSNRLSSYASLSTSYCRWAPSLNDSVACLKNTASSKYPYLSFSGANYFTISATAGTSICLWKAHSWNYSTSPSAVVPPVTTYDVSFTVPDGVDPVGTISVEEGCEITLPEATAPDGYEFLGWVTDTYNYADTAPSSVLTGTYTPATNVTLHALYSYTVNTGEGYGLLSSEPSELTGRYVITYGNGSELYLIKGVPTVDKVKSLLPVSYEALSDTEIYFSGDVLAEVPDEYIFTAAETDYGITLRNAATRKYLSSRGDRLSFYPSLSARYCSWTLSMNGTSAVLNSTTSSAYSYLSFSEADGFGLSASAQDGIHLWQELFSTFYTTVIY